MTPHPRCSTILTRELTLPRPRFLTTLPHVKIHTIDLEFQGSPGLIASFLIEPGPGGGLILIEPDEEEAGRIAELLGQAVEDGQICRGG